MTLVVSMLTPAGTAIAADRMITTLTDPPTFDSDGSEKLLAVPSLRAVLGAWGKWRVNRQGAIDRLRGIVADNHATMADLAAAIADDLNRHCAPDAQGSRGVHVVGYGHGFPTSDPAFYHVHDGPSSVLSGRGIQIDPNRFNANPDYLPHDVRREFDAGNMIWMRTGRFVEYARMFGALHDALRSTHLRPWGANSYDLAKYLRFQIKTTIQLFLLSGFKGSGIGGQVDSFALFPTKDPCHTTEPADPEDRTRQSRIAPLPTPHPQDQSGVPLDSETSENVVSH